MTTNQTANPITEVIEYASHTTENVWWDEARTKLKSVKKTHHIDNSWQKIEYDERGNEVLSANSDGLCFYTEYDKNGNVTKTSNSQGDVITYNHDHQNRIIQENINNGQCVHDWTYHADGTITTVLTSNTQSALNTTNKTNSLDQSIEFSNGAFKNNELLVMAYGHTLHYCHDKGVYVLDTVQSYTPEQLNNDNLWRYEGISMLLKGAIANAISRFKPNKN